MKMTTEQSSDQPAGRILRTQIEQGWSTETLEMLGRRFIEENGMSAAYAAFLEREAEFENGYGMADDDGDSPEF